MFKLLGGELKKIFLKPMIYIMVIILGITLGLSLLIYNPETRTNSSTGLSLSGLTTEDVKLSFGKEKNTIDSSFNSLVQNINNFVIRKEVEILTEYENANQKSIIKLTQEYNEILLLGQAHFGNEELFKANLGEKLQQINNAYKELKEKYNKILNSSIPHVIITESNNDKIIEIFENVINETTTPSTGYSVDGYKAVGEAIVVNNYAEKLNLCFSKISNVGITQDFANELIDKYCSKYYDRQNTLYNELNDAKNKNDVLELYKKYYSNFSTVSKVCYGKIYQKIASNLSDKTLQSLINTNFLNSKLNLTSKSINKNFINETVSTYNYIWEKGGYDFDYNLASNSSITVGTETSATDFCLFGMQISTFIIIIMCVILGATSISSEINNKTIKTIAVKPISRTSIIIAKLLATLIIGVMFTTISSILSFGIGAIAHGYNSTKIIAVFMGKNAIAISPILYLLIYLISSILKLTVYVSLAIMLSVLTSNNIPALIISLIVFFAGSILFSIFPNSNILAYLPFINLDLFVFFGGCVPSSNLLLSLFTPGYLNNNQIWITLSYLIALPLIFNLISIITFNKRDIA